MLPVCLADPVIRFGIYAGFEGLRQVLPVRQVLHEQSDPPGIRRKGLGRKKGATGLPGTT
jgi:hypothetical protein